jgi:hypothetical protein
VTNINRDLIFSAGFEDTLIKRSVDAELVLQDCGRIRFQRAMLAAIELYLEQQQAAELERIEQNIRPADTSEKGAGK